MITPALITALAGLLTTAGVGAAWLIKRLDARKDQIPRAQADVAQASEAVGGALAIVQQSLTAEIDRLRAQADADRAEYRAQIDALRDEVRDVRSSWGAWYRDLADHWETHRARISPPPPPHD